MSDLEIASQKQVQNTAASLNENRSSEAKAARPVAAAHQSSELQLDNRRRASRLSTINDYAGPRFIKLTGFQHLAFQCMSMSWPVQPVKGGEWGGWPALSETEELICFARDF